MNLSVFLSTAITGVEQEEQEKIFKYVEKVVRNEYECFYDSDNVTIFSNFDEGPAPASIRHKKIFHLERAFNKMKDCDIFFLLKERDGSIKPGCMIEMNAWITSSNSDIIIRNKTQMNVVS